MTTTRPERPNAESHPPDNAHEENPTRPLRTLHPDTQALIRNLIELGDITGVVQNGELYIRWSEIEPYTPPGSDPSDWEL